MSRILPHVPLSSVALLVAALGCASEPSVPVQFAGQGEAVIAGLDRCDDFTTAPVDLDPDRPVHVLVHGCYASSARLAELANVFETRGEQAVCFSYDDRGSLDAAAHKLATSLEALRARMGEDVATTVLGHSQGGLVSRRALTRLHSGRGNDRVGPVRLVTISSPFRGIEASSDCGKMVLHVLTLGITVAVCRGIAGAKWRDIHPRSSFIRKPGAFARSVIGHLKINTDERGTCRVQGPGEQCKEDDFVFSLQEQYFQPVDQAHHVTNVEIDAGHAAVIGTDGQPPHRLVDVLLEQRVLSPLSPRREAAFRARLAELY
jgi:hypothetical protein